jgi:acetyltransferase-like isoleucine patch superfamily enzyme
MQMTFKKIRRKVIGFFTGRKRLNRLKKTLRKELRQDFNKELRVRLREERKTWSEREKARRKKERMQQRMPKRIIHGLEGNSVQFEQERLFDGTIRFRQGTSGNVILFRKGSSFEGTIKVKGSDNVIEFGEHSRIRGTLSIGGKGCRLTFGDYCTSESLFVVASGKDIHIGKWCMISRNVEIRTTDSHAVVDRETRQWVNPRVPVFIGDHVWICADVTIMKGSRIQSNSIVGAMSVVNRPFEEEGVVLAGIPAKVVKRGVTWHRILRESFTEEDLEYHRYDNKGQLIEPAVSEQVDPTSESGRPV